MGGSGGASFLRSRYRRSILFDLGLGGGVPLRCNYPNGLGDMPPTTLGSTCCPVCKEALGSVAALGAHYNSLHAIRDNRLVINLLFVSNVLAAIWTPTLNGASRTIHAPQEVSSSRLGLWDPLRRRLGGHNLLSG